MSNQYELIVIGLGPAGASLLYKAAEKGIKVLGIDKRREIGIPIQCGEFIPAYSELETLLPETPSEYLSIFKRVPRNIVLNKTRVVRLYTPYNSIYEVEFKGLVVNRASFDKWLVSKAIEYGAEVYINSSVYKLDSDGGVYVKGFLNGVYKGDVVAIAAGASSRLLDQVGLYRESDEYNLAYLAQYVMDGVEFDSDIIEMYTGSKYAPGAYAWIIPRGGKTANVGVGIRYPYVNENITLKDYLTRFIKEHPIASNKLRNAYPVSMVGGVVPVAPPAEKTVSGRFISLGDSANHVIASLGAGIVTAVVAGVSASEAVYKYLNGEAPLNYYESLWRGFIGRVLEDGYKLRLAIDILTRSDRLIEYGMKILGKKYIWNLVYTKAPKEVDLASLIGKLARDLLS